MGSIPGLDPFLLAVTLASELDRVARNEANRLRRAHGRVRFDTLPLPLNVSVLAVNNTTSPTDLSLLSSPELIDSELERLEVPQATSVQERLDGARRVLRSIEALSASFDHDQDATDRFARGLGVAVSALYRAEDLVRSRRFWNLAWQTVAAGSGDWEIRAALLRLRARILRLAHRDSRAIKLLQDLCGVHRTEGEGRLFARAAISLSTLYSAAGYTPEAFESLKLAAAVLDPATDRVELLGALFNLGWIYDSHERFEDATACLARLGEIRAAGAAPPTLEARILWLKGREALRTQCPEDTERCLQDALVLFLAQGELEEFCCVSLEHALAVFEQDRAAEVPGLLEPAVEVLRFLDCPEEQLAAVILLNRAAWAGELRPALFWRAIRALGAKRLHLKAV